MIWIFMKLLENTVWYVYVQHDLLIVLIICIVIMSLENGHSVLTIWYGPG